MGDVGLFRLGARPCELALGASTSPQEALPLVFQEPPTHLPTLRPRAFVSLERERKDVPLLSFRSSRGCPNARHKTYADLLCASRRTPISTRPAKRLPEPTANSAE